MHQVPLLNLSWDEWYQANEMVHRCGFSGFLRDELTICPCDAYPCLLRAADSECVLLLHVDDVLCLVKETCLNETLVPALRAKCKISLDVFCKEGMNSLSRKENI